MYAKTFAAFALAAAQLATADFYLYSQQSNDIIDAGGGSQTQEVRISSGEVSCDDTDSKVVTFTFYNDASSGGAACDGCDISKAVPEQNIERLEIWNGEGADLFSKETGSITLYQDRNYDVTGGDGITYGNCERITDAPDDYVCSGGAIGSDSGVLWFKCISELTVFGATD